MLLTALLEKTTQNNTSLVVVQLLKLLKVPVTTTTVIDTIEAHPDYPSLFSISDSLRKWKIDNVAVEIEEPTLNEVPTPFIAYLKGGSQTFVVVNKVNETTIEYVSASRKKTSSSKEAFLKQWGRVVLVAEATPQSGEKDYVVNRRKEWLQQARIPAIIIGCLLLCTAFFISTFQLLDSSFLQVDVLLIVKLVGCIVTSLLLWYEIDKANPVLQQICTGGKNTNCNAVLGSKGSKIFNWLSWSEIGFFYFAGGFLFLLSSADHPLLSFSLLSWLNLFALPYTFFSIFYQWKVIKQWCPLCLIVQALLITEAVVSYFGYWSNQAYQPLNSSIFLIVATSFLIPIFFWLFAKLVLLKAQQADQYKKELNRLKYNTQIFDALLPKQKAITAPTDNLGITIGNPNATNTIIKVCNPYCGPCAKVHPIVDEIVMDNPNVKVQIIFNADDDEKDIRSIPVKHFMALYEKDANSINKALDDWYSDEKKDYETFSEKYKLNGELKLQGSKLKEMNAWCKETGIEGTPTFFINGYQLPQVYRIEDIKYLLS